MQTTNFIQILSKVQDFKEDAFHAIHEPDVLDRLKYDWIMFQKYDLNPFLNRQTTYEQIYELQYYVDIINELL